MYNVFNFTILGFALLTMIYLAIFPSDRDHLNKVMAKVCMLPVCCSCMQGMRAALGHPPTPLPPPLPRLVQIKQKKGLERKGLDRKISQQGGALSAVLGTGKGKK